MEGHKVWGAVGSGQSIHGFLGSNNAFFTENGFFLVERVENLEMEDLGSSPSLALESEWCLLRCGVCSLISSSTTTL